MAVAFEIIYSFSDEDGDEGTTTFNVPTSFSLSQYTEFGAAMATLVNNIVQGKVESADLCLTADISGVTANVTSGADDVEDLAAFKFRTADNRPVQLNIPGLDEQTVLTGSDELDQSDPAVAGIIDMMTNGIVTAGGTIQPCDIAEDDVISTEYARERFRASGSRR